MKTQGETRMWRYVTAIMVGLLCAQGALATSPNDCQPLDVYMRSAKIYMGAQGAIPDFKSAQKQLDKAIECYPTTLEARFLLSKIMWNKRLYDQFLDLARALDTLDHQRQFMDTIWQMRRAAWGELFNKGVDSLKASNQIDLDRAKAQESGAHAEFDSLTNVGRRYLESAKGLFLASLDMDSSRSEPYQNLGVIDVRLQNWNDALVWYRKSLATKPTDPDLMRNMVSLNLRLDQQDSALHYVHAILLAQPDDLEQLTNLAGLYAKKGFADSANLVFEEIIAKDPNNKPVLFNLGMTQVQFAQTYADQIQRYSKQANEYTTEYNKLAGAGPSKQLDEIKRKRDDAITSLKEAKSSSADSWAQAGGMFERLAGLDSTDYEANYFWGMSLFWLEKYDAALVPLQHAVELKADYCEAWQIYYFAAARANQPDLSKQAKEKFDSCGK
jgi:tetratricopeptide (TPR) repeat protein